MSIEAFQSKSRIDSFHLGRYSGASLLRAICLLFAMLAVGSGLDCGNLIQASNVIAGIQTAINARAIIFKLFPEAGGVVFKEKRAKARSAAAEIESSTLNLHGN